MRATRFVRVGRGKDADVDAIPETGLRVMLDLPRLEVDQWTPLFSAQSNEGKGDAGSLAGAVGMPDLVAARIDELVFSGKTVGNLVLGATRAAELVERCAWAKVEIVCEDEREHVEEQPERDGPGQQAANRAPVALIGREHGVGGLRTAARLRWVRARASSRST